MKNYQLTQILREKRNIDKNYYEFLHETDLSMGIYELKAGSLDMQQPHTEDEVYYIINGRAQLEVESENIFVESGSIIYVKANMKHRFHTIKEDLTVLVFFAPAEYSCEKDFKLQR
ncbi:MULTISPECIES: cupin domain-containing protein [Bacillus]|uniref:Cupin n=3 Tax=Bacillus cereus group TaxID=86661 RepID=A0A1S9TLL1_BACCE|nr:MULTISPECIES: cupin domain-containing protein [Bacillus]ARJ25387.1 cupin [Bacillus mycoides]MBK5424559.1 cupin domain-containing protein [Bacillus sp. TH30]MBK5491086.1 cupin domain-containing protein [Bacillus sp. TH17]MED1060236.1 cupin domain-containing protein [Bacillus mycoides]OOR10858.1 cupin [Bacillus cereus]